MSKQVISSPVESDLCRMDASHRSLILNDSTPVRRVQWR